jgi:cell division protein FtsI (penicillin-binding protein 3)
MINFIKKIRRIDIIAIFVVLVISIILLRSFNLQYTEYDRYSGFKERIEIKHYPIKTSRGSIVDRNNNVLAESIQMNSLIISDTSSFLKDSDAIEKVKKLCVILDMNFKVLLKKLKNRNHTQYTKLKKGRYLSSETREKILALGIDGIYFEKEFQRYYPEGEVTASLIGMTKEGLEKIEKNGVIHSKSIIFGQMGLEKSFDEILKEEDGEKIVMIDKDRKIVNQLRVVTTPKEGKKLILTIDKRLQYVAYRELKKQAIKVNAKSGSVVILDSTNGDILAIANYPSYDPNDRRTYTAEGERNRAIIDSLEPASTIKPFLLAAALHSKKVKLEYKYNTEPGRRKINGKEYADIKNNGILTAEEIVVKSSNIGSVMMLKKFDNKIYYDLLEYVGIGEIIGINFPYETEGKLEHYSDWRKLDQNSHAIGYAFKASPLQLAKAYSVIANEGFVINPRIEKDKITYKNKSPKYKDSFSKVKNIVLKKVIEDGTGKKAKIDGYSVGGKTGTGRLHIKKEGYDLKNHISLFAGITPLSLPKLVIVVVIDQPQTKTHGGSDIAAPVFNKIATDSLRILNVSPDNISDYQKNVLNKIEYKNNYILKTLEVPYVL